MVKYKNIMIMNTSKFLNSVLSAFMMMGLGMGVVSCSDSDNNENGADNLVSTLTLDEKVARFGVETEMEGAVVPLNVACKGAWSVAVEKGKDWVSIENNQVFYQGSQTLQLLFDENRTEVDRTAILYITNLISLADWLHIYIDKTSIENQVFPKFQEFRENPKGKLKALIPVFQWLNFEVPSV